ncbi:unnamed protein product [Dibothriocephalus latus]|uniref:GOLD domain-containing protein n=1 Tax=Dibothriocephalus latus TaxID=60516 RepID=A0A3P6TED0_DIBLA|nr:unnamed protein product [Dibothriocephalus latus]
MNVSPVTPKVLETLIKDKMMRHDNFIESWMLTQWNLSSNLMLVADSEPCARLHLEPMMLTLQPATAFSQINDPNFPAGAQVVPPPANPNAVPGAAAGIPQAPIDYQQQQQLPPQPQVILEQHQIPVQNIQLQQPVPVQQQQPQFQQQQPPVQQQPQFQQQPPIQQQPPVQQLQPPVQQQPQFQQQPPNQQQPPVQQQPPIQQQPPVQQQPPIKQQPPIQQQPPVQQQQPFKRRPFAVCLDNRKASYGEKVVYFAIDLRLNWQNPTPEDMALINSINFRIGEDKDKPEVRQNMEKLERLSMIVDTIATRLHRAQRLQQRSRNNAAVDRVLMEANVKHVMTWSTFQLFVMIFVGVVQTLLIRSLFDEKSSLYRLWVHGCASGPSHAGSAY